MQKNDEKHDTIIHGQTDDSVLCHILQWACLVNRIWTCPRASLDTSVCTVWQNDCIEYLTSKNVLQHLQSACATIGSACLSFEPHKLGTHSLPTGAAMDMYLSEVPVYIIMLQGRWSSNAFLCYIWKQIEQFSRNVVKKMLTFWSFHHIPDITPWQVSLEDPHQRNHCNDAKMRTNIGRDKSQRVQLRGLDDTIKIHGRSIYFLRRRGRRIQFQTLPPVHILCTSLLNCVLGRHLASKLLC